MIKSDGDDQVIKIIDRTLSCLDDFSVDVHTLKQILTLLLKMNCDGIELSENVYQALKPLPSAGNYLLRIDRVADMRNYPEFRAFVCEHGGVEDDSALTKEIKLRSIDGIDRLRCSSPLYKTRISGLDDALLYDYSDAFQKLKNNFAGPIEFCPMNRLHCATGIATEWALVTDNAEIVTSFGSLGDYTSLEELTMTLCLHHRFTNRRECRYFVKMRDLIERVTHVPFSKHKAVIGRDIFQVESGIHVDGIRKNPRCYEPYSPELVGQTREIVLGKKSGKASLAWKLEQLHLQVDEQLLPRILQKVKQLGARKNGRVNDREFIRIVNQVTQTGCTN